MREPTIFRIQLAEGHSFTHPGAMLDDRDRQILSLLQENADLPISEIATRVALSPSACSRRIQRLEGEGYIARRVAVLDRGRMNLPTTIFVVVKTSQHAAGWLEEFRAAVSAVPEIVEVHRLTGNFDYILKIVLPNVEHYDTVYKRLVSRIQLSEMSAYISMETLKHQTALPTRFAGEAGHGDVSRVTARLSTRERARDRTPRSQG